MEDAKVNLSSVYLSCGCNKGPHLLDWGLNHLISYGSSNNVVLYDPKFSSGAGRVLESLTGHEAPVTSVRWIKNNGLPENELISTSADGSAIVWRKSEKGFNLNSILKGHLSSVTIADAIYSDSKDEKLILATAAVDSTIKIWRRSNDQIECGQTISCGSGFAFDVKFSLIPNTDVVLLASGLDDSTIVLFIQQKSIFEKTRILHGHEDWVRCIDIISNENYLYMATGSQDSLIRIWKMAPAIDHDQNEINLKENIFTFSSQNESKTFSVSVEAIIAGHENWVYGVHWHPKSNGNQPLKLISASMDKTMILWSFDTKNDLWLEQARVGDVSGNSCGFYGNKFGADGRSMMAHSFQGAFHLWRLTDDDTKWVPGITSGGHFDQVLDIEWDPKGRFLLSTSSDQTTRLHALWWRQNQSITWHELARPQIHGYDMTCLTTISGFRFVSGADEKVLRVFEAPRNFVSNLSTVSKIDLDDKICDLTAEGASVPALGLSNKAIFDIDTRSDTNFKPVHLTEPPTEEMLQNTLWPEIHKLYGHGYEVFSVASNRKGTLIASACKATKPNDAFIILWDTNSWTQIARLYSHSLTVTDLTFSPDDRFLLSISRDRSWTLFESKRLENGETFEKFVSSDKRTGSHSRIVWSCAWAPGSSVFVTGSRDKKVVAWEIDVNDVRARSSLVLKESVNALDVAPVEIDSRFLVAIGLESGNISLRWFDKSTPQWILCTNLNKSDSHSLCVKRLRFSPIVEKNENNQISLNLASCAADFAVRIIKIKI